MDKTIKEFFNDLYEVLRLKTKKVEREYAEGDDIPEGAKVGDKIYFETNSDYEMDIEGERLFRMKNNDLIYVIKE